MPSGSIRVLFFSIGATMDIAMESQWNHDPTTNNFVSDNDYEKEFESYISDVDDDDGKSSSIIHSQIPIFGCSF